MSGVQKAIKYGAMAFGIFLIAAIIGGALSILGFFHLLGKGDVLDTPRTYPIAQDVNSLELEISAARLNIVQGDTFALESNLEKLEILQEGGKLTLRELEKSWFSLGSEGFVTLTVPQACVLDKVELSTGAAEVNLEGLTAREAELSLGAGKAELNGLTVLDSGKLEGGAGKITLENAALHNFRLELGVGTLDFSGSFTGSSTLDCGVGSVEMHLAGSQEDYTLTAKKGLGTISIAGESVSDGEVIGSGSHTLTGDGTLEGVESGTIVVSATDSRGNTTTKTVERKLVGYVRLSCTLGQGTPDASGRYDLEVVGACYYGSFGGAENTLTVEYRYRAQGTEAWGAWTAVDRTTPMGFTYVAHATVKGLDYQTAYEFQARAADVLEQVESEVKVVKASPGFDWGKDDFAFHIPVYIQGVKVTPDVGQNLLINPFFTVNQRGSTTYTITKPAYTLDCWKTSGDTKAGEVVVGQRYAKLTNTSGTLGLGQFVEDYGALAGETVTLSMAVDILSGSYHLGLNDGTGQAGEVLSQKGLQVYALTATLSDSPSQLWCQLISEGAASCRIFGAKLEVGDHQTLAIQGGDGTWQLTQQPNPEEILRCYRYQYVPVEGDTSYPLGYGFAFSTSSARMVFPCGVKMRLAPSVTFLNGSNLSGIGIFNNGASHTPTAVAGTRNLPGGVGVIFTTSGLVTNDVCTLRSISGKLLFDANL